MPGAVQPPPRRPAAEQGQDHRLRPQPGSDEQFRKLARDSVREHSRAPARRGFLAGVRRAADVRERLAGGLPARARALHAESGGWSTSPSRRAPFEPTIRDLGEHDLVDGTRLIVEKPFGHDLPVGATSTATIHDVFDETQVFRIDHYLGKETVQNILVFRFGNGVFERVWNRDAIDHIADHRGRVDGHRGAREVLRRDRRPARHPPEPRLPGAVAADDGGALLLRSGGHPRREGEAAATRCAPSPATTWSAASTRDGHVGGEAGAGLSPGKGRATRTRETETFAALRLHIDNWRWAGVPFYLRTGKRMPKQLTPGGGRVQATRRCSYFERHRA